MSQDISALEKTFQQWVLSKVTVLDLLDQLALRLEPGSTLATKLADTFCPDPGQKARLQVPQSVQDLV